jgi:hypothetical protein
MKEGDVRKTLRALEGTKATLNLALAVDHTYVSEITIR